MTQPAQPPLAEQVEYAWLRLSGLWLKGLSDEEFWWEPGPDCWTVRLQPNGHWQCDYAEPDPVPAPLTNIAWKVGHLASCKHMYIEYAYGPAEQTWDELEYPRTLADALRWLDAGHDRVAKALAGETDLAREVATNWGGREPAWWIFWTLTHHDLTHGAEIGLLRDLFRSR